MHPRFATNPAAIHYRSCSICLSVYAQADIVSAPEGQVCAVCDRIALSAMAPTRSAIAIKQPQGQPDGRVHPVGTEYPPRFAYLGQNDRWPTPRSTGADLSDEQQQAWIDHLMQVREIPLYAVSFHPQPTEKETPE